MKSLPFNKLSIAFVAILFLSASCKKDEQQIFYSGGTSPVLTSSISNNDTIPLIPADSLSTAVSFSWTNPNYEFTDGISSLDVTYYLEIDTAGANFSSPHMQTVALNSLLDTTFSVTQFNAIIGNGLQVSFNQPHNIQVRVQAFLPPLNSPTLSNPTTLNSNVYNFTVVPYAPPPKIAPPSSGQLFLVGSATAGGWNNPVPTPSQQFTQISSTEYSIVASLIGGQQYLFIPVNGSWDTKYAGPDADDSGLGSPSPFLLYSSGGNNFVGPASGGNYKIDVNFQTGTFTVTAQ